jgi:NAD(P)-dependent dehydrogenase (short-subunit alcohol dehydrogenase family)
MRIQPGTRAFVTGASRGIGRALARALAVRGAFVGLAARSAEELDALAGELGGEALTCDVGDAESVRRAVDLFAAGGLDLVVANAGTGRSPSRSSTRSRR